MERPRHRVRVTDGKVFIGTQDGEYTIWESLESIIFWNTFLKPEPAVIRHGFIIPSGNVLLRYYEDDPNVETIEPPY